MEMEKNAEANKELVRNSELKSKSCILDRARADLQNTRKYFRLAEENAKVHELELKATKDSLRNTREEL